MSLTFIAEDGSTVSTSIGTSVPVAATEVDAPANPTLGMMYFSQTLGKLRVWTGVAWETVSSS